MANETQNQFESEPMVRLSLASVPDQSNLMPPPQSHSSINEGKQKRRKRKCQTKIENLESECNSTEISTSIYGNSQESIDVCDSNVVHGKRARTKRTQ